MIQRYNDKTIQWYSYTLTQWYNDNMIQSRTALIKRKLGGRFKIKRLINERKTVHINRLPIECYCYKRWVQESEDRKLVVENSWQMRLGTLRRRCNGHSKWVIRFLLQKSNLQWLVVTWDNRQFTNSMVQLLAIDWQDLKA